MAPVGTVCLPWASTTAFPELCSTSKHQVLTTRKDHWGGYGRVHIQNVSLSNFVLELHKEEAFLFVQYIVGKGQLQPEQTSCKHSLGPPGPVRSRRDLSRATPKPNL